MKIKTIILDKRITPDMLQPATSGSAGIDLYACIDAPMLIRPGQTELIPSGIAIHIDQPGYAAYIYPRSGKGHKQGLVLGNSTGIIDSDYTGQIFISVWNRKINASDAFTIMPMDKIAQLLVAPVIVPEFNIVESFNETERGAGGFGSTG